jgi:hypothetical protein
MITTRSLESKTNHESADLRKTIVLVFFAAIFTGVGSGEPHSLVVTTLKASGTDGR